MVDWIVVGVLAFVALVLLIKNHKVVAEAIRGFRKSFKDEEEKSGKTPKQ